KALANWLVIVNPTAVAVAMAAADCAISGFMARASAKGARAGSAAGLSAAAFPSGPVTGCFTRLLRRFHDGAMGHRVVGIAIDARLDLRTEIADQALDRPGRSIAERADGVAFDLLRHLQQHV